VGPNIIDSSLDGGVFFDKPAVVVSPASNSMGWIYVVYARSQNALPNSLWQIYMKRSTDGGVTFTPPALVSGQDASPYPAKGGAQVVVDGQTGHVNALWVNYGAQSTDPDKVEQSLSTNFGASWGAPFTVATATNYFPGFDRPANICCMTGGPGIRAITVLAARLNRSQNNITVVWHEAQSATGALKLDVYAATRTLFGWQPKRRLNDVTTNDQFMPSVDFDSSGSGLVSFYDRREDPANNNYKQYATKITSEGIRSGANFATSTFASSADNYPQNFIGDYQQTWFANLPNGGAKWISIFIGNPTIAPGFYGDAWLAYSF
jgi:hypothetical protein